MKTSRSLTYFLLAIAGLIGGGGLMIFMVFLFRGSFNIVDLGMSNIQVLAFDVFLCLFFFAQHSLMARKPFRLWLKSFLPAPYYGGFYAVASGIAVLVLVIFWLAGSSLNFIFNSRFHASAFSGDIRLSGRRRSLDRSVTGLLCQFSSPTNG
jgi:hypothetical protein